MQVTRKPGASAAIAQAAAGLNGAQGRVGWFPSAVYEEGGQPVAGIAAVQEFGSPARGIPPRLGMRTLATEKREAWKQTASKIARAVLQGKMEQGQMMNALTQAAEGHMRAHITKITAPPLAEATVAARRRKATNPGKGGKGGAGIAGITKPLVDTGLLLNTLTSETN